MTSFLGKSAIGCGVFALVAAATACSDSHFENTASAHEELTVGGPAATTGAPLGVEEPIVTAAARTGTQSRPALFLDGQLVGFPTTASGGAPFADVIEATVGQDGIAHKHLGGVKYEDIDINVGASMSNAFWQWLDASLAPHGGSRKDGSVTSLDYNFNVVEEQSFNGAFITEIGMPALDGASKDAGSMHVRLTPDVTRTRKGSGKVAPPAAQRTKAWTTNDFRLELGGLDTTRVVRIEPMTFTRKFVEETVGETRGSTKTPTNLVVSNLVVTLDASGATAWTAWRDAFLLNGDKTQEKSGRIVILAADMKNELFSFGLETCGIFKLENVPMAPTDTVRRVQASIYCDAVTFTPPTKSN
jgi:hypothetical protein